MSIWIVVLCKNELMYLVSELTFLEVVSLQRQHYIVFNNTKISETNMHNWRISEMPDYNKLVRDLIPDIIQQKGKQCQTRILSETEYQDALIKKLQEEVTEFTEQPNLEELADILEVVHALTESLGADQATVEDVRKQKALERGGFEKRIFLEWVD